MTDEHILVYYTGEHWKAYKIFTKQQWEEFQVLVPDSFIYYGKSNNINLRYPWVKEIITDKKRVDGFIACFGDTLDVGDIPIFDVLQREGLFDYFERQLEELIKYAKELLLIKRRYTFIARNVKLDTSSEEVKEILTNIEKKQQEPQEPRDLRKSLLEVFKRDKDDIKRELDRESDPEYTEFEFYYADEKEYAKGKYPNDKYMRFILTFSLVSQLEYPLGKLHDMYDYYQYRREFDKLASEIEKEFIQPMLKKYLSKDLQNIVTKFISDK